MAHVWNSILLQQKECGDDPGLPSPPPSFPSLSLFCLSHCLPGPCTRCLNFSSYAREGCSGGADDRTQTTKTGRTIREQGIPNIDNE